MKKFLFLILLFLNFPVWSDLLLSPQETFWANLSYKVGSLWCFGKTPLYDGENCYSCEELKTLVGRSVADNCERICPNRYGTYECGPSCILKAPPDESYTYVECKGWVKER